MATINDLDTIRKDFSMHYNEYVAQKARLEQYLEKKKAEVRAQEQKIASLELAKISWIGYLVKPLMLEVIKQLPGWHLDDMAYTAQDAYVSIFCFLDPKLPPKDLLAPSNSIYIRFLPGDLCTGALQFDCTEPFADPHPGEQFVPVESIEQVVAYLQQQVAHG